MANTMLFGVLKSGIPETGGFLQPQKKACGMCFRSRENACFSFWGTFWPPWRQCLFFNLAEFFASGGGTTEKRQTPFEQAKRKKSWCRNGETNGGNDCDDNPHLRSNKMEDYIYTHKCFFLYEKKRELSANIQNNHKLSCCFLTV